jgi:DeoR family fructose operon transcriptional repressor
MAKKIAAQRQKEIVELLEKNGGYKMTELAEIFQVSKETIRRDLIHLNEIGAIQKKYGGAVSAYEFQSQPVSAKSEKNHALKEKICKKALEFIQDNSVIYLDTGSTCACLASMLSKREGLTIITNSLSVAQALIGSKCIVHVAGGQMNSLNLSFEGYQTTNFLGTVKVETAFFGTTGFDQHNGPTTIDFLDAQAKQTILHNSKTSIVLTDSSKATSTALSQYATWQEIDYLISDDGLPKETISKLGEYTQIITV